MNYKIITTALLAVSILFGSDLSSTETDSLQLELQKVNEQLKLYEQKEKKILSDEAVTALKMSDAKEEKVKRERKPGFGGGGGPSVGFKAINIEPLKKSITDDIARKGDGSAYHGLDFENKLAGTYETFLMLGGQGLAGIGNGVRIGGGAYGGAKLYRTYHDVTDSAFGLTVWNGYCGFIVEKSFPFENANVIVGTLLGGGAQGSILFNMDDANSYNGNSDTTDTDYPYELAVYFAGEVHAGVSYSFLPWFHMGLEFSGALFASGTGFKNGDSFTTFNPGGNIRFMFGRIS